MHMEEILQIFPVRIQTILHSHIRNQWTRLQEIRCRIHQSIELVFDDFVIFIEEFVLQRSHVQSMLNQISAYSLYRMEDELREGYMTIKGGHRIGLAGEVTASHNKIHALQYITFLNIRIAKEHQGCAQSLLPYIYQNNYKHTLIIGAPKTGKTSLIRDATRLISNGWGSIPSKKVGLVDERSEIAASHRGIPTLQVGRRTDVLDRCPKVEGMMMFIRSMSPEVLVVDEIGSEQDIIGIQEAMHAGVSVICTAHANSIEDIRERPSFQLLFQTKSFMRIVHLNALEIPGTIQTVYDAEWNPVKSPLHIGDEKDEVDWRTAFH